MDAVAAKSTMGKGVHADTLFRTPLKSLIHLMGIVGSFIFVAVAFIVVIEVVMRSIFHLPQIWTGEMSGLFTIVGSYFMFAYTLQEKGHTRVDFISMQLSERSNFFLETFTTCLSAVFCAGLTWFGVKMIVSSRVMGEGTPVLQIPLWIIQNCVPLSGALMFLVLLRNLKEALRSYRQRKELHMPPGNRVSAIMGWCFFSQPASLREPSSSRFRCPWAFSSFSWRSSSTGCPLPMRWGFSG